MPGPRMDAPTLTDSIDIDAPVDRVWELVSDVCRMPQWSPQVRSTRLRKGFDRVELGTQFTSLNSHNGLEWVTRGEIVRFTAPTELAFRIAENWVVWSFALEPATAGGTRLTQRRETPDGISEVSRKLTEDHFGGPAAFTESLRSGMRETLEKLKAASELAADRPPRPTF